MSWLSGSANYVIKNVSKQTKAIPSGGHMRAIELFAGAGGLGIGVSRAGLRLVVVG